MRVLGGQHLAGTRVSDDEGGCSNLRQPFGALGRVVDDHAPAGQFRSTNRPSRVLDITRPGHARGRGERDGQAHVAGAAARTHLVIARCITESS